MANPRKFSEKIALHTQKQAEETAAFEAIMREVSGVSRVAYQKHHLQLSQNLGAYRGGSLPNVNQIGTNSIDLQNALHNLEDMKQGRQTSLVDRMHRDRNRQVGHRRPFPFDKRVDCSPYGSAYLSPPPDTSWRRLLKHLDGTSLARTNSDSALHTSAMAPVNDNTHGPNTPPTQRRVMEMIGDNHLQADGMQRGVYFDPKKLAQSRPKSCEVPNINIYPSQEQDSGVHIPISNNTGSLPDLTNLHFPSPLATPLDVEDQAYSQGSPANLSPTSAHHMAMVPGSNQSQQQSPVARRRHPHGGPSPLVLTGTSNQMRLPLSPPVATVDPSQLLSDPRIRQQYILYLQQQQRLQQQQQRQQQQQQHHHHHHHHQQQQQQQQHHHHQQQQHQQSNSSKSPPSISHHQVPQIHISCPQTQPDTQPSMTQYRNSTSDTTCQSPTSPLSQPSYSPAQSPGLPPSTVNNSPFADAYYLQQQQQQQTNSLQHQFEQFNMLQDNQPICTVSSQITKSMANNGGMYITGQPTTVNISQVGVNQGVAGDYGQQRYYDSNQHSPHQVNSQQHHTHMPQSPNTNNKIPDIILTGADDPLARQDFAKDLGNAITGMSDSFDTDFFPSDEALKVGLDPLDLDGLQMLTDPNMVADPATEDTFRLDRL